MRLQGLDTKEACFLCLQKISRDDYGDHRDRDPSLPDWETGFSMRIISRFLKVDQQSVLLNKLHNDKVSKNSFSVTLCQKCYTISSNLACMITELEKLKMMLDHQVILFHENLAKSQKQGNLVNVWQSKDVNQLFDGLLVRQMEIEATLIDTLRQETEEKCRLFIKSRSKKSPRVQLHRLEDQQTRKRKLNELETTKEQISDKPLDPIKTKTLEDNDLQAQSTEPLLPLPIIPTDTISSKSPTNIVSVQKMTSAILSSKPSIEVRPLLPQVELQQKIEQISLNHFDAKPRIDLPPVSVPLIVPQRISVEDSEMGAKTLGDLETQDSIGQSACVPPVTSENMKLKSGNIAQKIRNAIESKKNSPELRLRQCAYCEVSFPYCSTTEFDVHLSNIHPDKLFASKKPPQVSDAHFKKICLDLLLIEVKNTPKLNRHQLPTLYSCLYCRQVFEKAQRIKCHYIKCHYEIMSEKLVNHLTQNYTNQPHPQAVMQYETTSTLTLSIHPVTPSPPIGMGPPFLPMSSTPQVSLPPPPLPLPINQNMVSTCPNPSIPFPVPQQYRQIQVSQDHSPVPSVQPSIPPLLPFNTICNTGNSGHNYNGNGNQVHNYQTSSHVPGNNNGMISYYYPNSTTTHHQQQVCSNYSQAPMYKRPVEVSETTKITMQSQNTPSSSSNYNQGQMDNLSCARDVNVPLEIPDSSSPTNFDNGLDPQKSETLGQRHVMCPYCKILYKVDEIKLHLVKKHLEDVIFSESRLSRIDVDQFKAMRKLFLQQEVDLCRKTLQEESRRIINHCPYCAETFFDKLSLRVHLCHQHYSILKENFNKVQARHVAVEASAL